MYFAREGISIFFLEMPQNRTYSFSDLFPIMWFFLEISHFFMFENLEMPHLSHLTLTMGYFKILDHKKAGHFEDARDLL